MGHDTRSTDEGHSVARIEIRTLDQRRQERREREKALGQEVPLEQVPKDLRDRVRFAWTDPHDRATALGFVGEAIRAERARVVAFLRAMPEALDPYEGASIRTAAEVIEAGNHLEP